jgi:bleomycin hydrolase
MFVMKSLYANAIYRFVFQVVVPKALAPKDLVKVFEKGEKVVLPPWDPMVRTLLDIFR